MRRALILHMLPAAYADWFQLIYTTVYSDVGDLEATFFVAGIGAWTLSFGPGPSAGAVFLPGLFKNSSPQGAAPPPPPPGGYPPPVGPTATPAPTAPPYPPPGGLGLRPPALPSSPTETPPVSGLMRTVLSEEDEATWRAHWLFDALYQYRRNYCPQFCVNAAGEPTGQRDRVPVDGFTAHLYALAPSRLDTCAEAAAAYTNWAERLDRLSLYFARFTPWVPTTDFYIKETGLVNAAAIEYALPGQPWLPESQSCNLALTGTFTYEACLANLDLSNRISWHLLDHIDVLPGARATGASWLTPDRWAWDPGLISPTISGTLPYMDWMSLGRGMNCAGLLPTCPLTTNLPLLDWTVSPNAYGYFLGAHYSKTNACRDAGLTPVELGPAPEDRTVDLWDLFPRGYGPLYREPPDHFPPTSQVDALPLYTDTLTFPVCWTGTDFGGIAHYDIYYADESTANWAPWREGLTTTQALFTGAPGHTYHFCSAAADYAGNQEHCLPTCLGGPPCWPLPGDAQAAVIPWSRVDDLPAYTAALSFDVSWSGSPDVKRYDVQVRSGEFGAWSNWLAGTRKTTATFQGQYGQVYYFRSRGQGQTIAELYPYDYDTYTKLVLPSGGEGLGHGGPAPLVLPPDEAPDRREEVTRTQALGLPVTGYIAPVGDVDWYRFTLTATTRLRIRLDELPADYDLYVFDGHGQFRWASTWGRFLPEEVVVRVPAGVYYVRLTGYAGAWSGKTPYELLAAIAE